MNQQQSDVQPAVNRPNAVTVIAILLLVGGAWQTFKGIILVAGLIKVGNVVNASPGTIILSLVTYLGIGILALIVGIGLLKLKKWALNSYFVLGFISLIVEVVAIIINRAKMQLMFSC